MNLIINQVDLFVTLSLHKCSQLVMKLEYQNTYNMIIITISPKLWAPPPLRPSAAFRPPPSLFTSAHILYFYKSVKINKIRFISLSSNSLIVISNASY